MTRGRVVLIVLAGAIAALAGGLLPWVVGEVVDAAGSSALEVTGGAARPGLMAAALAAGAGGFALTLADGWWRRISAVVVLACGLAVLVLAGTVLLDPASAAQVAGASGVSVTAAPWLGIAAGVLLVLGGGAASTAGERWPRRAARQVSEASDAPARERSDWDRLSDGDDPT